MKRLEEEVILFDDSCPMCRLYTHGFVRAGWLRPEHRLGFSQASEELRERLDLVRARREIPLFNPRTGEIHYGLGSLFFVLGRQSRALAWLGGRRWFRAAWTPLYYLISYNRRAMAGFPPPREGYDCAPDFHAGWWAAWLGVAAASAGLAFRAFTARAPLDPLAPGALLAAPVAWAIAVALAARTRAAARAAAAHAATMEVMAASVLAAGLPFARGTAGAAVAAGLAGLVTAVEAWRRRWVARRS